MDPSAGNPFARFAPGEAIGVSSWTTVTQPMIDQFGTVTLDPDPMHVDPDWAKANGPFGGTIAFGFLTVSLLTHFLHDAMGDRPEPADGFYLNYGFDRLRLVAPVPVGSRLRGHFRLIDRNIDERGRHMSKIEVTLETEGSAKPALFAEWIAAWVPVAQE